MQRIVAFSALAAAAAFVALVGLLHALQPEDNDNDALSEYALGEFGWLMNGAFFTGGVAFAGTALILAASLCASACIWTGAALVGTAALGWLLVGAGNIDPGGEEQTTHGLIHGIGFLLGFPQQFVALAVALDLAKLKRRTSPTPPKN